MKKIIIAIDGYSSCGKSTLAKALGKVLGYAYIDTGAMYRAVTYYFLEHEISVDDELAVRAALPLINIHFEPSESGNQTFLNGKNIETEIRQMRVSNYVSPVAAVSTVRKAMVEQQQMMGKQKGIVMDGRDIGTVVFPTAELKIFLTAEPEIRTQRRYDEYQHKGTAIDFEVIKTNLLERDHIDSTRSDSPLKKAENAIVIDNSYLSPTEQLEIVLDLAREKIQSLASQS
ncbi:MAG: (d)CMP kinase [Saprospiraceae bacterium]